MKNDGVDIAELVEKKLDQISVFGEWVGKKLGALGRTTKNVIVVTGVLIIFGITAFLWALGKGLLKKK